MNIKQEAAEYINSSHFRSIIGLEALDDYKIRQKPITLEELAQGEYNVNYVFTHPVTRERLVLRVNLGSQMHLDHQIEYEANALFFLGGSGRTPRVIFADESEDAPGNGIIVMEMLPGSALDYSDPLQLEAAAGCLADIHSVYIHPAASIGGNPGSVPSDTLKLISPLTPMRAVLEECEEMIKVYLDSELPEENAKARLRALLDNAWELIPEQESAPYRCCINTELNSTNFLYDNGFARLVDWEKPLYGDPAQDLGHFLAPTTTFWKTDVIFDEDTVSGFIDEYIRAVSDRYDTSGLRERTLAFIPVTCLRGLTWCAMAWVQYQGSDKALINESTRIKLDQYLSDEFISDIESRVGSALSARR